jgi:hypothetical protein
MQNYIWNPTLRLGAVRTIEGYEKIVDLEELIAHAKSESNPKLHDFVNRTIHEDILLQEDDKDEDDGEEFEVSMEDLKNIVDELLKNKKFREDVGLDGSKD